MRILRRLITIKRFLTIIAAVFAAVLMPAAAHAYNVVDLPETMTFDEALGVFSSADITGATISNYTDRKYIELSREQIDAFYEKMKGMVLTRGINPEPFRGTSLNLTTVDGTKSYYVNSGLELGKYGDSNYVCYKALGEQDMIDLTDIETMYRDAQDKVGGELLYRSSRNDFLVLPTDGWAQTPVKEAAAHNLLPYEFTKKYSENITREDFCKLLGNLICVIGNYAKLDDYLADCGKVYNPNAFADCAGRDPSIFMLDSLGIVSGRDGTNFDPDGAVTREEAAAFLCRTAELFMHIQTYSNMRFTDTASISPWARVYAAWVSEQSIMNGSDGRFMPLDNYTVIQAVASVNRVYKVVERHFGFE